MVGVGSHLWRSSGPLPPQAGPHRASCQGPCSDGFLNIYTDGDPTASLGNPCQCSITLTVKKCFLVFKWNLMCFSSCLVPFVLSLGTTERNLAPSSSFPLIRCLHTLGRSPQSFLFSGKEAEHWDTVRTFWGLSYAGLKANWRQGNNSPCLWYARPVSPLTPSCSLSAMFLMVKL